jgi:hypothetical protein
MPRSLLAAVLALSEGATPSPELDERCAARQADPFCGGLSVVWCDTADSVAVETLARHAAPILWFSPDEPLLSRPQMGRSSATAPARRISIPQALGVVDPLLDPDPEAVDRATVYWQLESMLTRPGQQTAVREAYQAGRLLASGLQRVSIGYSFYYRRDEGLNPHYNDLEGIQIQVHFEPEPGTGARHRATVARVTGLAHGSELVANILQVSRTLRHPTGAPDVTLPITILVEEGKHASSPDRNADGSYTPGYDVNIKTPDAWGVRDVFGSGVVASRYAESMTKPRRPWDRVGPDPASFQAGGHPAPAQCYATPGGLTLPEAYYSLVRAPRCWRDAAEWGEHERGFCMRLEELARVRPRAGKKEFYDDSCFEDRVGAIQVAASGKASCRYLNMLYAADNFHEPGLTGFLVKYKYGDLWLLQPLRYVAPAVRLDGNDVGPALTVFSSYGLPKFAGWFMARGAMIKGERWRWQADVSYTPSLARLIDWYVAGGYDWGSPGEGLEGGWALEAGLQIRHRAVWLRTGARSRLSGGEFGPTRVVAELGFGPKPRHAKVH